MLVGLDFDNTIVSYTESIAPLAKEVFRLPQRLELTKLSLRDFLRSEGREEDWIKFQGLMYGPGMKYAKPYRNAISIMNSLSLRGHTLAIISHRSRYPYSGDKYDLHGYALDWLNKHIVDEVHIEASKIFFLETKQEKLLKIKELRCDVFLDDLTSVLEDKDFPIGTRGVLFSPHRQQQYSGKMIMDWDEMLDIVNGNE